MKMDRLLVQMTAVILVIGSSSLFSSCSDNNTIDYTSSDNANVQSEANSDAQTAEIDDLSAVAVSSDAATLLGRESWGGRTITISDDRFKCATVTLVTANDNSIIKPHGTITIDFGTACTGPGGMTRTGKIIVTYTGRRFLPGSSIVTATQNFAVNGIKVEGTRTLTNTSTSADAPVSFSIVEDGVKITWTDGTFAIRSSTMAKAWNRTQNPLEDSWTIKGSAIGTNRKGKEYTMTTTKELVYKRSCAISNKVFMAVSGIKELITDKKKVSVDYGNGDCDNKVTITINGKSKEIEATSDGN